MCLWAAGLSVSRCRLGVVCGMENPTIVLNSTTYQPHNTTMVNDTLCTLGSDTSRPMLVVAASSLDYLFRLWPYFCQKVKWARDYGWTMGLWLGSLPERLAMTVGDECRGSEEMSEKRLAELSRRLKSSLYTGRGVNSNHYNKILAVRAALETHAEVTYVDLDTIVLGEPRAREDVFFPAGRLFWHPKSSAFFIRRSPLASELLCAWVHWRCGFKDQYALWHALLRVASHHGCVEYNNEVFNFTYKKLLGVESHPERKTARTLLKMAPQLFEWPTCPEFRYRENWHDRVIHKTIAKGHVANFTYGDNHTITVQDMFQDFDGGDGEHLQALGPHSLADLLEAIKD
ncbi:hypothetical protein CTAYLR_007316 [Chrysophaeum taylorii]|uniref:Nucleotide-diphospho-sugar transferase domain-containing protein n=1 Tax=Chrysophaeum taylorii TaxID=2483200 RepID=A0AAD7U734_9STRA|nr:hypothetical protein CTAYLR_007316 [Chrysophaeum taylorii]